MNVPHTTIVLTNNHIIQEQWLYLLCPVLHPECSSGESALSPADSGDASGDTTGQ